MITLLGPQIEGQSARSLFLTFTLIFGMRLGVHIFSKRERAEPTQRPELTTLGQKTERLFATVWDSRSLMPAGMAPGDKPPK